MSIKDDVDAQIAGLGPAWEARRQAQLERDRERKRLERARKRARHEENRRLFASGVPHA